MEDNLVTYTDVGIAICPFSVSEIENTVCLEIMGRIRSLVILTKELSVIGDEEDPGRGLL